MLDVADIVVDYVDLESTPIDLVKANLHVDAYDVLARLLALDPKFKRVPARRQ